ncbi:MAG: carboxysome shell carbonic anhydrase [Patescibacteria group bacterium]|nr:carboxysome shell carbonic anhydrase [Patescibacteria group bacterium]MDD5716116.1 carboxysome shell carbonic anhydrase [Patescibacteria group bacterium]
MLRRNAEQSAIFCSPDAKGQRLFYRVEHPTEILWFKCMDGRLNGAVITETPLGLIQPIRNLAGSFDLGWPHLADQLLGWVEYSISMRRRCLVFVTYHWSKSITEHGCKGHNFDVEAARADARKLKQQIEFVFGYEHQVVYPIIVGIETDEDALLLHGDHGGFLNMADSPNMSESELRRIIGELYPDMPAQVVTDLIPLLLGNQRHIQKLRQNPRLAVESDHGEVSIAIGKGFDWLHWLNKCVIIGPFAYNLMEPVEIAARILLHNLEGEVIPVQQGALLMVSGAYRNRTGFEHRFAELKARELTRFTLRVIHERVPELEQYLHVLAGIVNLEDRLIMPIDPFRDLSRVA